MRRHRRTLAAVPDDAAALAGLFDALDALGHAGTPAEAVARTNLGETLRRRGEADRAESHHRRALVWLPEFGGTHFNLGVLLQARGRLDEAAGHYAEAVRRMPGFAPGWCNLGVVHKALGDIGGAEAALRTAVGLAPDMVAAQVNLGAALRDLGRPAEAAARFRAAVAMEPGLGEAAANLGVVLKETGDLPGAVAALERALALGLPDAGAVLGQLVQQRRNLCRWDGLAALSERLVALVRGGASRQVHPWIFLGEGAGPALEMDCAARYTAWRTAGLEPLPAAPHRPAADGRLRIGYLSGDFHEHATAVLIAELIERHDRGRVAVAGYSYGPDDGGPLRARLRRGFDRFVDLAPCTHAAAAQRIRDDGIDILVDLKGHTQGARPEIPALRPAPVQAQWLGYPGTTGAPFFDWVIADPVVAPASLQRWFSERIVQLPDAYQPNDRRRPIAPDTPARAACGLPETGFVFCCFNAPYKITPSLFAVWMRLLRAVPGSVLWLIEGHPESVLNLRRAAGRRGVAGERLVFAPKRPLPDHLARHRLADLFLDTAPVGAHTTASDALWAGLPLLTLTGDAFAGRVAASLLTAVGLPGLAVGTMADYEATALALARDPPGLAALRDRLAAARGSAPLFDSARMARALEAAYAAMWAAHRR